MSDTIHVYAVEGRTLPREDVRHRSVEGTKSAPIVVPNTPYYRRAIARGDIAQATPTLARKGD